MLDCTLRDGGYCNNWTFGQENIKKIINRLMEANLDIIECGYLSQKHEKNSDRTQFTSFSELASFIPKDKEGKLFVVMVNFGEYPIDDIPDYDGSAVDGFRVCFHKKNRFAALEYCRNIREKGYKVFVQGMVSLSFSDEEFIDFIKRANEIDPYAFYIVDSFGMMKEKDLVRLFYMVEHNLENSICIGFHSHNNMQLAYSNCLCLAQIQSNRTIILDASVYGMGRGAGNLNTELFIQYLNENRNSDYVLTPLLAIIDEILDNFYQKNYWGYSLPNYISAKNNAHPNYASFLNDKKTLTVEDMENIFQLMDEEKKVEFDKFYIETLYTKYLATGKVKEWHKEELISKLKNKRILLIAPGKSSLDEKGRIIAEMQCEDVVSISVNFDYENSDFIFLSNLRRYRDLDDSKYEKCIVTSNIASDKVYLQTRYRDLLVDDETVRDNAGLMAIKFLISYGVKEILLVGFDGYSHEIGENYVDDQLMFITKNAILDAMNKGMNIVIKRLAEDTKITFFTTPKYISL